MCIQLKKIFRKVYESQKYSFRKNLDSHFAKNAIDSASMAHAITEQLLQEVKMTK